MLTQSPVRRQYELSKPLYAKRSEAIKKIPNFWPLVLEQVPLEVDQYIQPHDSVVLAESLLSLQVNRQELDADSSKGNPRSFTIRMEFGPNSAFEDTVLEKQFWYRRAKDGWTGLMSEPVKINWKAGKDPTQGLTDGAVTLFEARKKVGDMTATGLPEYTALKKKVEHWNGQNTSFFTWFGWVSGRRWVSSEESEEAIKQYKDAREKRSVGDKITLAPEVMEAVDDQDEAEDDSRVEVHETGEDLAIAFAEDVWPNAIKYFTSAQEEDEEISEADFEDTDGEEDEPIDIRALIQDKGAKGRSRESNGDMGPPPKRPKK